MSTDDRNRTAPPSQPAQPPTVNYPADPKSIDALDYVQTKAAIAETQARLSALTDHCTSLEVAYKLGTHWRDVIATAFTSDDGVRVAWLSGSRLVNLSGVGDVTAHDARRDSLHEDGTLRDHRTGEGVGIIHEHRTGEGGVTVEGGVSTTVAATSVDHENTPHAGGRVLHHDARRLTITVSKKLYQHVDETPDGHWVYRFDK